MRQLTVGQAIGMFSANFYFSFRRLIQQSDNVEQRTFAAPRRTHNGNKLSFFNAQINVVERNGFYRGCPIDLFDVL